MRVKSFVTQRSVSTELPTNLPRGFNWEQWGEWCLTAAALTPVQMFYTFISPDRTAADRLTVTQHKSNSSSCSWFTCFTPLSLVVWKVFKHKNLWTFLSVGLEQVVDSQRFNLSTSVLGRSIRQIKSEGNWSEHTRVKKIWHRRRRETQIKYSGRGWLRDSGAAH